jgi:Tryptophan/tyrosine permease family
MLCYDQETWVSLAVSATECNLHCSKSVHKHLTSAPVCTCNNCAAAAHSTSDTSILTLAQETVGSKGALLLSTAFFFLMNATLVSQLARAGSLLSLVAGLPHWAACAVPASALAAAVFYAPAAAVDAANTALTGGMLCAFCCIMAVGLPAVNSAWLLRPSTLVGLSGSLAAVPVILQLLVYSEMVSSLHLIVLMHIHDALHSDLSVYSQAVTTAVV